MLARLKLQVASSVVFPVPLVPEADAGYPTLTLWSYRSAGAPSMPRAVQLVASDTSRQGAWHPSANVSLAPGDYLVEVAPTITKIGLGRFRLSVWVPTAEKVHRDVQHVGNTGLNGGGMTLAEFLGARGSFAKSRSTARSDPSDPVSPSYPCLTFTADWCSVPSSWKIKLLQTIINSLGSNVDLAPYIVQKPSFGGVTIPFYYACLRHDFNWRNLHRVKHHFEHTIASVWNQSVRSEADRRLRQDLILLCSANQYGEPEVPATWNWTLTQNNVKKCKRVAEAFKVGVSVPAFPLISYSH